MDAWRAPCRILSFHSADQVSDFVGYLRPPHWPSAGSPLPEQRYPARCQDTTVSGLTRMSASYQLVQIRRTTTQKKSIESIQAGARLFALVNGKLLSKSNRLHCQTVPSDQKRPQVRQHREQSGHHHSMLIDFSADPKLLIREAGGVLMTYNCDPYACDSE